MDFHQVPRGGHCCWSRAKLRGALYWKERPKTDRWVCPLPKSLACLQQKSQPLSRVHRHFSFPRDLSLLSTSLAQVHQTLPCATTMPCSFTLAVFADTSLSLERFCSFYIGSTPTHQSRFCLNVTFSMKPSQDPSDISFLSLLLCALMWNIVPCIMILCLNISIICLHILLMLCEPLK